MDLNELRDKVCDGIRKCLENDCRTCPYWDEDCDGSEVLLRDALRVMEGTDWEVTTSSDLAPLGHLPLKGKAEGDEGDGE